MVYDLEFLKNFDGNILPSQINISDLVNVIEKHVSQFRYYYQSDNPKYSDLIIEFYNLHIPQVISPLLLYHLSVLDNHF